MNGFKPVLKREFKSYFATPVAYVFLVVFLTGSAITAFAAGLYENRDASLRLFFDNLPLWFALLAPAVSMRLWAEERRSGSVELLLTLPVTIPAAVLAKFLASWLFFGAALLLTLPLAFTIMWLGDPDLGPMLTGYVGAMLMAGAYLAIGNFFSAITKNQVVCFILAVVTCGTFALIGYPWVQGVMQSVTWLSGTPREMARIMGFATNYDAMQRGVVAFSNIFYQLALMTGFLASTCVILDERKAQ